jgi:hypothetical protein
MNTRFALLAFLLAAQPVLCQQTWKVDCNGAPGSHFTDLPAAVAAASPGDTLLVYVTFPGGTCGVYTAPTITKPLNIVGFYTGMPPGNNTPTSVQLTGTLSISGIAQGERLLLSNMHLQLGSQLTVMDCPGSVLLEDIYFLNLGMPGQVVRFERCANVILRGCDFTIGGAPLWFIDTNALLTTTVVVQYPPLWFPPYYATNTESLNLLRSRVTIAGSVVWGPGNWNNYGSKPAAVLDASTLRIGASSDVHGGVHPAATPPYFPNSYVPTYTIVGPQPSIVEKDPRSTDYPYWPPGPTPVAIHETLHDWVVADENFHVITNGPPGGTAMLFVGDMLFPTPLPPYGILGCDPATALLLSVVPLSSTFGTYQWTLWCPPWIPNGYAFAFQSLTISPTGVLGLTEPSPLTVAWEKDRIP